MKESDIQWSRKHCNLLKVGGTWGVPRSGLFFKKTGEHSIALYNKMPFDPNMSVDKDTLDRIQKEDFECIARHFRAAGITVEDKTGGAK